MLRVRDLMTADPVTVTPDLSLRDLAELLTERQVSGVPVVEGRRTVGVVTLGDVVAFLASRPGVPTTRDEPIEPEEDERRDPETGGEPGEDEAAADYFLDAWADAGAPAMERFAATTSPEWDQLSEHSVAEAMTRRLLTITPEATVAEAAGRMRDERVHRLLVMQGETLVGVVSASDVTAAAAGKPGSRAKAGRNRRWSDR